MTILEATVEITKAAIGAIGNASTYRSECLLTDEKQRKDFLNGIEALYKKLDTLDADKLKR